MTDHTNSARDDMDDIELITRMLNGQLDPERVAAVRRRLEEDPAFRDLAAPLLLAWSVPRHLERKPRPAGELERDWNAFTQRTGFGQQRPAPPPPPPPPLPRRRWRGWLALVVLMITAYGIYGSTRTPVVTEVPYSPVPYDTGWIALGDGIDVQLSPGASLRTAHRRVDGSRRVQLDGTARFRIASLDSAAPMLRAEALVVETRAGLVTAGESEFTVAAHADTTRVSVHPLGPRRALQPERSTVTASTELDGEWDHVLLRELDGALLITGHTPERILPSR